MVSGTQAKLTLLQIKMHISNQDCLSRIISFIISIGQVLLAPNLTHTTPLT